MSSEVYPAVNTSTNMKQYKIVVLGNPNVGKTTLTYKLCEDKLLDNVEPTISLDLRLYVVNVEGENIKLQIWDTAGQERFHHIVPTYYRNTDAVVIVYDVTDQQSFNDLGIWMQECANHGLSETPKILIANKCDKPAVVNRNLAQCFADLNGMLLFETSSYPDSGCDHVQAIFYTLAHKLKSKKPLSSRSRNEMISIAVATGKAKNVPEPDKSCCIIL